MIEVTNLSKKYGNHTAVKNVSFSISEGEIVGFLGPNGAGKSTIMNILTGYLSLTEGSVTVDGFDVLDNPEQVKKRIGYLPEQPPLYPDMTVKEYLGFVYDLKNVRFPKKAHLDEIERLVNIKDVENRLIKNLSKGYKQRVGIAQALVGNPDVLILDEPTVGLDPKQIIEIRTLIANLGKHHTVILSSHILSEIQAVCKRILIINSGVVVADDTAENLSNNLSSDHAVTIRVQGPEGEVQKLITTIKGVQNVTPLGMVESGSFDFLVEPVQGVDVRRDIFSRLSDRKWPLIEITTRALTLEQIFLRLTEGAEPAQSVAKKAEKAEPAPLSDEAKKSVIDAVYGKEEK